VLKELNDGKYSGACDGLAKRNPFWKFKPHEWKFTRRRRWLTKLMCIGTHEALAVFGCVPYVGRAVVAKYIIYAHGDRRGKQGWLVKLREIGDFDSSSRPDKVLHEVRFYQLDSLRGLAAITVVFLHFQNVFLPAQAIAHLGHTQRLLFMLVSPLATGNNAVVVFFVLSGFVLMLPFLKGTWPPYRLFVLRRILRIYGPYLVALLIAMAGAWIYSGPRDLGDWLAGPWAQPPTLRSAIDHLLLVGIYPIQFNPIFWTLVVEMRVSLIFPVLATGVLRFRARYVVLFALLLAAIARFSIREGLPLDMLTLEYTGMFVCGMVLARNLSTVGQSFSHLPKILRILAGIGSLALYLVAGRLHHGTDSAITAASISFIVVAMYSTTATRLLNMAVLRLLGRISYSLYLSHVPVLMVIAIYLGHRCSALLLLPLYVISAIGVAALFYLVVERPFTQLSRRVAHVQVREK